MNVADEENFNSDPFIEAFGLGARIKETKFRVTSVVNMLTDRGAALEEGQVRQVAAAAYADVSDDEESSLSVLFDNSTNRRLWVSSLYNHSIPDPGSSRRLARGDVTIVMLTTDASKAKSLRQRAAAMNLTAIAKNVTGQDVKLLVVKEPETKVSVTVAVDVENADADDLAAAEASLKEQLSNDALLSRIAAEAGGYEPTVEEEPTIINNAANPSSSTTTTPSGSNDEEAGQKKNRALGFVVIGVPILSVMICCCCCGLVFWRCFRSKSSGAGNDDGALQSTTGTQGSSPPPNLLTQARHEMAVKNAVPQSKWRSQGQNEISSMIV
jgi:hypothetical protein